MRRSRQTLFRTLFVIGVLALMITLGTRLTFVLRAWLQRGADTQRATAWLAARFGADVRVGSVRVGWRTISVENVALPLDASGSRFSCRSAEITLDPLRAVMRPERPELAVRRLRLSDPELCFSLSPKGESGQAKAWLPQFRIPASVFELVQRCDSLRSVEFTRLKIVVSGLLDSLFAVGELNGSWLRSRGSALQLGAEGRGMADARCPLLVTGTLDPVQRMLTVQARTRVEHDIPHVLRSRLPGLQMDNGQLSLRLTATSDGAEYRSTVVLSGVEYATRAGVVKIPQVRAALNGDTLCIEPVAFTLGSLRGSLAGNVHLTGAGNLELDGEAVAKDGFSSETVHYTAVSGKTNLGLAIRGTLAAPRCEVSLLADSVQFAGYGPCRAHAKVVLTPQQLKICSLEVATPYGDVQGDGQIATKAPYECSLQGQGTLAIEPRLLGWESPLREINVTIAGPLLDAGIHAAFLSRDGRVLGSAVVQQRGSDWDVDVTTAKTAGSRVRLARHAGADSLIVTHAEHLLAMLFEEWDAHLAPLQTLDIRLVGNPRSWRVVLSGKVISDTACAWSWLLRDVRASAHCERTGAGTLVLTGDWSATSSSGEVFAGQMDAILQGQKLVVRQCDINEVGALRGEVRTDNETIDLELTLAGVPLGRFPLQPAPLIRGEVKGVLSGYVHAAGPLLRPRWTASMTLIDGTLYGVPGYWSNLDAAGEGLEATVQLFDLGRGTQKILTADGALGKRQVSLHIKAAAARAEDFLAALGWGRGVVQGELSGTAQVTGSLDNPRLQAEIAIRNGRLLGDVQVDDLDAELELVRESTQNAVVRVTRCEFGKAGTYRFSIQGELVPEATGRLNVTVQGRGDFLDIVDQLDGVFRTYGSNGFLHAELGGTLAQPEIKAAELGVTDGRFSYRDATPGTVEAELVVRVRDRIVEAGRVRLGTGGEWLEIRSSRDSEGKGDPIVISHPRLDLGVLEVRTSPAGVPLRFAGLMKPEWIGMYAFGEKDGRPVTIVAQGEDRLLVSGVAQVSGARLTYPFRPSGVAASRPVARWITRKLTSTRWNLDVYVGPGNHYDVEITGLKNSDMFAPLRDVPLFETLADYLDHLSVDAIADPSNIPLEIRGCLKDGNFYLNGKLSGTRGRVDYLDQTFAIDFVSADFDGTSAMPILEGRASTEGLDSLGRRVPVYLTMYQIDRETSTKRRRGRLNEVTFVLEGDGNQTPEELLALLGYDFRGTGKAEELAAATVARVVGRQWLDPLERRLERWTRLDEVALRPGGGRGFALARQQRSRALADTLQPSTAVRFFTGSQVTVGKYITRDLFVTYTGELAEGQVELGSRLGLVHLWNLEFRLQPVSRDLVLDLAVEYDEVERKRDETVSVKYSFSLEP